MPILHYLRTKTVNCRHIDLKTLRHEAEFYGVLPLGESEMHSPSLSPWGTLFWKHSAQYSASVSWFSV